MVLDTKTRRPAPQAHQKKHIGAHQRRSDKFMKTYWPYLPLFGIAGIIVVFLGARVLGPTGAVVGSVSVVLAGISFLL